MQLSKNQKEAVRTLLRYLGLNQAEFSKRANWSPSALSEVLKREDGKGVSAEKWVEVRQALKDLVDENGARLQEAGRIEASKMLLDQLQGRGEENGAPRVQFPGGPLSARALNYVQRHCDVALMSNLYRVEAPSIIIRGGIQYGKSSLLERFAERARELGHYVARADAKTFELTASLAEQQGGERKDKGWSSRQVFERIFKDFGVKADFASLTSGDDMLAAEIALPALEDWLESRLKDHERVFLLVDSLDSLVDRVEKEAFTSLLSLFAGLRTRSSQKPFDRLTLVVAYSGTGWSAAYASKFQSQGYELDVRSFGQDNVIQLLKLLEVKEEGEIVKDLREFFDGHPHLIHLAAYEISLHGKEAGLQMAGNLVGAFQTHAARIFQEVDRLARLSQVELKDLLTDLYQHIENGEAVSKRLQRNLPALAVMGLVAFEPKGVIVSGFYKKAIQVELSRLGGVTRK